MEKTAPSSLEAERWYREALAGSGAPLETHRELGLLLRARGRRAEAAIELARYLERAPQAEDRSLIEHYLEELRS